LAASSLMPRTSADSALLSCSRCAVAGGQPPENRLYARTQLVSQQPGQGVRAAGRQPIGQPKRRRVGKPQRFFPADAPAAGPNVVAMGVDEAFPGNAAEPGVERNGRLAEIRGQLLGRDHQGLLHHVGGIDPRGESIVHPHDDHLAQPPPVPSQQSVDCRPLAGAGPGKEFFGVWISWNDQLPTPHCLSRKNLKTGTAKTPGKTRFTSPEGQHAADLHFPRCHARGQALVVAPGGGPWMAVQDCAKTSREAPCRNGPKRVKCKLCFQEASAWRVCRRCNRRRTEVGRQVANRRTW